MHWRWSIKGRDVDLGSRCLVMGIVNVTPDSFSDGGALDTVNDAVRHALLLERDGADILDIGGESTRPGATGVPASEELARVVPVIERLAQRTSVPLSVDTRKPEVAQRAIEAGASIVNDVSGLGAGPPMATAVAKSGAGLVLMHTKGTPATMQRAPSYGDVLSEVGACLGATLQLARRHGIPPDRIVLDPGIGFGKTLAHNLSLIANPEAFRALDRPLLFGVSRKSMFGELLGRGVLEREDATTACTAILAFLGAAIVRVHDVRRSRDAVEVARALRAARAGTTEETPA